MDEIRDDEVEDLRRGLEVGLGGYEPDPAGLEGTLRRARRRERRRRVATAVVALGLFAGAVGLLWTGLRPDLSSAPSDETPPPESLPSVVRGACTEDGLVLETPTVATQRDGVHILVEVRGAGYEYLQFEDSWGVDDFNGEEIVLPIEPGAHQVGCALAQVGEPIVRAEFPYTASLSVVDEGNFYVSSRLACQEKEQEERGSSVRNSNVNPLELDRIEEVIRRAVPGIRSADLVQRAEYPEQVRPWRVWRVVRGGVVIASVRLPGNVIEDRGWWSMRVLACAGSGVGDPGEPTAGPLATPFEIPGYPRCDPYVEKCRVVLVSELFYEELGGEGVVMDTESGDYPWCRDVPPDTTCAVHPDDRPLEILMHPDDADAFTERHGCAGTRAGLCRSGPAP